MRATSPSSRRRRGQRGFALAAAIFALVIIAALVTGVFFSARQEMRLGLNSATYERAYNAAEAGLNWAVAQWNTGTWNGLVAGDSALIPTTPLPGGTGSYAGTVRRLNDQLFLIRATGSDPSNTSQRTLANIVRLALIQMDFHAALTTRGSMKIGGSAYLDGRNSNPTGWSDCPTSGLDTLPGVTLPDPTQITVTGGSLGDYVNGQPPVQQNTGINDSTFFKYGDLNWNSLVAMANKTYPTGDVGPLTTIAPVGTTTTCNMAVMENWGDPRRAVATQGCWNYFPIIYINGTLKVTGGYGQGILLVANDLEVQGGFEFYGPVIVRGNLVTQGTGGHFRGGVMAANVDMQLNTVLGNALITYSSCAVTQALRANSPGRQIKERSWAELF